MCMILRLCLFSQGFLTYYGFLQEPPGFECDRPCPVSVGFSVARVDPCAHAAEQPMCQGRTACGVSMTWVLARMWQSKARGPRG